MAAGNWLVQQQGRETFVTQEELRRMAKSGKLEAGDLVFHPVLGRWLYARQVEEIHDEVEQALVLAGKQPPPVAGASYNDAAIAGFTLGILGLIPVVGLICATVGLPLAYRGVHRSRLAGGTDRRFAVAGLALSGASLLLNLVLLFFLFAA